MTILIDSREQSPLEFSHPYINKVEIGKLEVGDYAVRFKDGWVPPFYFERKSLTDLFSSLTSQYRRFKKEIVRAIEHNIILSIIIEGTLTDILHGSIYSTVEGDTIVKKLFTLKTRYDIDFICCKNRKEMSKYITYQFISKGKDYLKFLKKSQSKK